MNVQNSIVLGMSFQMMNFHSKHKYFISNEGLNMSLFTETSKRRYGVAVFVGVIAGSFQHS